MDIDLLGREVSDKKIKKALFYMAPLKAPKCDGFHVIFFQK